MIVVLELSPVANSKTHDVEEPKTFLRSVRMQKKNRKTSSEEEEEF
jgi:hypothetical protein